jgi:hypothetical protein
MDSDQQHSAGRAVVETYLRTSAANAGLAISSIQWRPHHRREPNGNLISVDVVAVVVNGRQALHAIDVAVIEDLDGAGVAERRELERQLDGVIAEFANAR